MSATVRSGFWAGLIAGAAGGVVAVVVMMQGIFTGGLPVVALALWERALRIMPMEVFGYFIVRLKFLAKPVAFWGMLGVVVAAAAVLGMLLARRRRAASAALAFPAAWLFAFVPLALLTAGPAAGFLQARLQAEGAGPSQTAALWQVVLAIAIYAGIFAAVYAAIVSAWRPRPTAPQSGDGMTRRELLHRAVLITGGAIAGSTLARWTLSAGRQAVAAAQGLFERVRGLPAEVTPTREFYVVSKNPPGFDPVLNGERWKLEVAGLVATPIQLTYDEIRALPSVDRYHTLECISNEVGGDLISNAKWRGVPLRDVLAKAGGVAPKAGRVAFRCADGYTEAIPVSDALNPDTLLVYEINGERLPSKHGFPVRLLVPGLFGMKNPKWITKIEPVDYHFLGYWERSGWSDKAAVVTMSKFTTPRAGATVQIGEDVGLGGVAYAGDRGIRAVQVSTDDGKSWQPVEIKPPLGKYTWVLWAALWKPAAAGAYTLRVRGQDGLGAWQTAEQTDTLPNGATGYHRLRIRVRR